MPTITRAFNLCILLIALLSTTLSAQPDTSERVAWETTHSFIQDPSGIRPKREDSVIYFYSGIRNSVYDYNRLCYHCPPDLNRLDPDYTMIPLQPANIETQLRPNVQYDSFHRRGPEGSGNFPERWTQVTRYNADNTPAEMYRYAFAQANPDTQSTTRAKMTWNGYRLASLDYLSLSPGWPSAPNTADLRFIRYSAAGKVILDSSLSYYLTYGYDALGRCNMRRRFERAGWSWTQIVSDSMTYDTANRVVWLFHRQGGMNALDSYNDSFGYTQHVPGFTFQQRQYAVVNGQLFDAFELRIASRINSRNRVDSITYLGGSFNDLRYSYSINIDYNANGNPIRKTVGHHSYPTPSTISEYGYESYVIPDTSTPTRISTLAKSVSLSPNPTTGTIQFRNTGNPDNRLLLATITDPVGRRVRDESFRMQHGVHSIELGNTIPPGIYLIRILDQQGATVYSGKFERR